MTTQPRIIVFYICIRSKKKGVVNIMCPKLRWRDLKGERIIISKGWGGVDLKGETNQMTGCSRTVAKEMLGESKWKRHYGKETWWWSI